MRCRTDKLSFWYLSAIALMLLAAGCARTPMGNLIEGAPADEITLAYQQFAVRGLRCPQAWDGEVIVHWASALDRRSFSGYIQLLLPSYLKLVVSNPLGQPLTIVSTNGSRFHYLDALNQTSTVGSLRSFALSNNISPALLNKSWLAWISGRPTDGPTKVTEIRADAGARGAWLTIAEDDEQGRVLEHLLIDTRNTTINERIIVDEQAAPLATIIYGKWQEFAACAMPGEVLITGLSYGTRTELLFSSRDQADLTPDDFRLPVPAGYNRTYMP